MNGPYNHNAKGIDEATGISKERIDIINQRTKDLGGVKSFSVVVQAIEDEPGFTEREKILLGINFGISKRGK